MSRSGMQRPTTGLPVAVPDWFFGLSTRGIPLHVPLSINVCTWRTANGPWSATWFFPNVLRNTLDQLIIALPGPFSTLYQGGQQARTIGRCPYRHTIAAAHRISQFREYALSDRCVVSTRGCRPDRSHTI